MVGTLVRLVVSLATVLALMFVLARYLNNRQIRVGGGTGQRRKKAPSLEVVSRQGLSRASSLVLVKVSGQLLLLGVTESAVSVLREVEEEPDDLDLDLELSQVGLIGPAPVPRPSGRDLVGSVIDSLRDRTVRRG